MRFEAKIQERVKYGKNGRTPWTQKFVFVPSELDFVKGDFVEVSIRKRKKVEAEAFRRMKKELLRRGKNA